jgi:hypothetical protein
MPNHCSFTYSALASFRIGISGSASLQRAKKCGFRFGGIAGHGVASGTHMPGIAARGQPQAHDCSAPTPHPQSCARRAMSARQRYAGTYLESTVDAWEHARRASSVRCCVASTWPSVTPLCWNNGTGQTPSSAAAIPLRVHPLDVCAVGPATRILLTLWPSLRRRKINEQDVRMFPRPVEYNPAAIGSDVKGPHCGGIAQPGQTP